MPDISGALNSLIAFIPNLVDAFLSGGKYAIGLFVVFGVIYFLRRYL
ncbi:MAG TPA: hypothetical protein VFD70_23585 [Anaerolineae bacterium]|nr:hypothetical protein [Anaerolineae bacterium]